jgi:hypothetical protein
MRGASAWDQRDRATAQAWERFAAGGDMGHAVVRPQILRSWHRCRDDYQIDPGQCSAPPADDYCDHSLKTDRVVTELGSVGRALAQDAAALGGLVAITDGTGRVLTALGDRSALRHGEQSNLAPWSAWAERATGTNGMGTALEDPGAILVRRHEHWCEALSNWSCAGIAVRDPATGQPLAVLDVSCWREPLPEAVLSWLRRSVRGIERELRAQARRDAVGLAAALAERTGHDNGKTQVALDAGGALVAVSGRGEFPAGRPARGLAMDCPALRELVGRGIARARADHSWAGFAEPFIPAAGDIVPITVRPVVRDNRVIGVLATLGEAEGERLRVDPQLTAPAGPVPRQVLAVRGSRLIMLHPGQIVFAEAEGNVVWLTTNRGRVRARARGLDKLVSELQDSGFVRVHRHFAVNAQRVSEIRQGFRGQLSLVMDPAGGQTVPVSRRRRAAVRRALVR